ncbi:hypothetical protein [Negadavirga shengliensis]|uniref:Uncharacterized protein n=1 Tax=Negadavirga shengliensis TaxID=1389218 RepID=A0ABV9SXP6_9BACT
MIGRLLVCICFLNLSCGHGNAVEFTLSKSGENKRELQSVLEYYGKDDADSLKLKAAKYLIEYMMGHYSDRRVRDVPDVIFESYEYLDSLAKELFYKHELCNSRFDYDAYLEDEVSDSLYLSFESKVKVIADSVLNNVISKRAHFEVLFDHQDIGRDWLIDHIDNAFYVWETSNFARDITFDEFKNTLLVYRFRNESIDVKSSFIRQKIFPVVNAGDLSDIECVIDLFNAYTFHLDLFENDGRDLGNLGFYDLLQFYQFECGRHSEWTARVLNSCGIPANFDFTASWINRSRHHYWVSVRDLDGRYLPFTPKWQPLFDSLYFKNTSKVYRRTFSPNNELIKLRKSSEVVPSLFEDPYMEDVTEEYHQVTDIEVSLDDKLENDIGYLAIFRSDGWMPVAWGKVTQDKKTASFEKIPLGVTYIFGVYNTEGFQSKGQPFYLNSEGKIAYVTPDYENRIDLTLDRKFYKKDKFVDMARDMAGVVIQGANEPDFRDAVTLYTLKEGDLSELVIRPINIGTGKRFKYIRCYSPNSKSLNLSVFEIFTDKVNDCKNIGSLPYLTKEEDSVYFDGIENLCKIDVRADDKIKNLFDGNMESYVSQKSIEIELADPSVVRQIRIAPRNANNSITKGNRYVLLYFDEHWKALDTLTAEFNYLKYDNVPSGTLYWIRNLDEGKEEQAFVYENDQQRFINNFSAYLD